ncbi:MAG: Ig-like domain-containing protein [Verrucomicrobiota bacterium]|nr:Ig-like domain-containing protein [Verrucomicrobiota bacterium]
MKKHLSAALFFSSVVLQTAVATVNFTPFTPLGAGGSRNGQTFTFGTGGTAYEIDAFIYIAGIDLNGAEAGISARLSSHALPAGLAYTFTSTPAADSSGVTLTYSFQNNTGSPLGELRFFVFVDAEIDESINTFFNEFAEVSGPAGAGEIDSLPDVWQVDEPGFISGNLLDTILSGQLANTNNVPAGVTDDVAMGMGFVLGNLLPGKSFSARVLISENGSNLGGVILTQKDSQVGSTTTMTLSAQADLLAVVPQIQIPAPQTLDEDASLVFSAGNASALTVTYVDQGNPLNNPLKATLSVSHGTLSLGQTTGLVFITGDGSNDTQIVCTGTAAAITAVMQGMTYQPALNFNTNVPGQTEALALAVVDEAGIGVSGSVVTATVPVTVTAVNDAPQLVAPAGQSLLENGSIAFAPANSNAIVVADTDVQETPAGELQLTLGVSHGTLILAQTTGLTFSIGGGSAAASLAFSGTVAAINSALSGLLYTADANYHSGLGAEALMIALSDQGNTGSGGAKSANATIPLVIGERNDAPKMDAIADLSILEDAGVQTISLTGIDDGDNLDVQALTITATSNNTALVPNPTVNYASPGTTGSLTFTPVANTNGSATVTVTVTDNGGTANGGINTLVRTFLVTVTAVNDAPAFTAGGNVTVAEDSGNYALAWASSLSKGPANEAAQTLSFVITNNTNPSLFAVAPAIDSNGTLTFTPAANFSGTANISLVLQDSGGTANGGTDTSAPATFTVTVTAVNDQPTINGITDVTVLEDSGASSVAIAGIADGDADESQTLTISATSSNPALIPNPSVTYTSPAATGSLSFTPAANLNGTATITVTVQDNAGTANDGTDMRARTFIVTVTAVNDQPAIDAIADVTVLEDSGARTVNLTGIADGDADQTQALTISATSSNTALIPNPSVTYTSPAATGSLSFSPVANLSGTATITVTVQDNAGTANGGVDTRTRTFTVTVTAVNDQPAIDAIADVTVLEDSGARTVNLAGIADGDADQSQTLTISATSSNTALIPNPSVTYTSPAATGSLSFSPVANLSGTATITVTVQDNAGTANSGVDTRTRTFTVTVTAVNDQPTIDAIADVTVLEDSGARTVNLAGIADGDADQTQALTISAASSNTALIPNPSVTYTSPAATGSLSFTPVANLSGSATITVTVQDNAGTANGGVDTRTRVFTVTVTAVNDQPALDAIADVTVLEDSGARTVNLAGIADGDADQTQTLTISATSSNTALIPNPVVTYTSPAATGTLSFTPTANHSGTATITVAVQDNAGTANGGVDIRTRSFTVTVLAVNDQPEFDALPNLTIKSNSGPRTISITGFSDGDPDESQIYGLSLGSSDASIIAINEQNLVPTGKSGTATITVTLKDSGGTANGGIDTRTRTFTVTVESFSDSVFANYTPWVQISFAWTLDNQTGYLKGTLTVINPSVSGRRYSGPFWLAFAASEKHSFPTPNGTTAENESYIVISDLMATALSATGNRDQSLDPGETVVLTGVTFYSRDRSAPASSLFHVWATVTGL